MSASPAGLIDYLRRRYAPRTADGDLVRSYAADRDESAFRQIVARHGPTVLRLCRRRLGDLHAAEDAFQATFLTLARGAGSIRKPDALAAWLYAVAYRITGKARVRRARQRQLETRAAPTSSPDPADELSARELLDALDDELHRLPERYRLPLWLSYWQGLTQEETARRLGCSLGAVKGRLERGRAKLAERLTRRGLAPSALLVAPLATATVSRDLLAATAALAADPWSKALPVAVLALAATSSKLMPAAALGVLLAGVGLAALAGGGRDAKPQVAQGPTPVSPREPQQDAPPLDRFGDPLPDGALARLGSIRLRHIGVSEYVHFPDSKTAVTVGSDRAIRTWDLTTGRETRAVPLQGDGPHENWTAFSPDGKIVAASANGRLTIWDAATGREIKSVLSPEKDTSSLNFSPAGKTLAVGTWHPLAITLIDWQTDQRRVIALPARRIGEDSSFHAHFSPDGKWFVAGGGAGESLCVFETDTWQEIHRLMCDAIVSVITPDGKTLAVSCMRLGGARGTDLRLFDLTTGRETASFPLDRWHYSLAVSPDGKTLACGRSDGSCLVDLATGRVLHRQTGSPLEVMFTPDGKTLVARSDTANGLRLWDVATGAERLERPPELGRTLAIAVSPDGRLLATAAWGDRAVTLWDPTDGRLVRTLPLAGENRYVRDLAFSPDGQTLSAAQYKGFIQFWEVASGREGRTVQLHDPGRRPGSSVFFYRLHVSTDGQRVTTLEEMPMQPGSYTRLAIWDTGTGKLTAEPPLPAKRSAWTWAGDEAVAVPFLDGLAVYEGDKVRAWYWIVDGSPRGPVAASPSGRLLASRTTANGADAVGIWDLDTGLAVATLATGPVNHLTLAADGRTCVAAGGGALQVWDLATGRERGRRPLPVFSTGLMLTTDGRRAVTTLADGTGLVWDLTAFPAEVLARPAGADAVAGWWADLASENVAVVHAAAWRLANAPADAVIPLLARHLHPAPPDAETLKRAIAELDSASFAVREGATRRLEEMGGRVVPALRQALTMAGSAEARRRLEEMINGLSGPVLTADGLRRLRAVRVLERLGTAEARKLLAELADGPVHPREARAARAALERLGGRPGG